MDTHPPTVMVDPGPSRSPWLVGEVLGTVRIPDELVEALPGQFITVWEFRGTLMTERQNGWGIHYFMRHIASRVDLLPGLERLGLLGVA